MRCEEASGVCGRVNSYESCGTVDGPGLRFVVFLQGCPLRCLYCHNPESWEFDQGDATTAGAVFDEIRKYRNFMKASGGGVSLSGGEPLSQLAFVEAILTLCKQEGIHSVVDTSGFVKLTPALKRVVELTDLFLLDVKSFSTSIHQMLTGKGNEDTLAFAHYLAEQKKPMTLRYVLVPNLNDHPDQIEALASWAASLGNVTQVELLPFHKMGEFKWEQYGLPYRLAKTAEPSSEEIQAVLDVFRSHGLDVY